MNIHDYKKSYVNGQVCQPSQIEQSTTATTRIVSWWLVICYPRWNLQVIESFGFVLHWLLLKSELRVLAPGKYQSAFSWKYNTAAVVQLHPTLLAPRRHRSTTSGWCTMPNEMICQQGNNVRHLSKLASVYTLCIAHIPYIIPLQVSMWLV